MLVLVTLETAVVVLLTVLVAGLLRSHADVLRALHSLGARIGDPDEPDTASAHASVPPPLASRVAGPTGRRAPDLVGVTPTGEAVGISVGGVPVLVAFLSSGCATCAGFWQALEAGGTGALTPARVVAVTRDPAEESPAALATLAPGGGADQVTVVMSTAAWDEYAAPGSPYFVYVDAEGRVAGEGTAARWDQLLSLCARAVADGAGGPPVRTGPSRQAAGIAAAQPGRWATDAEREAHADRELLAAGIHPGHPSLYPDRHR